MLRFFNKPYCGDEAIWMYAAKQLTDCFIALRASRNDNFETFSTSPKAGIQYL